MKVLIFLFILSALVYPGESLILNLIRKIIINPIKERLFFEGIEDCYSRIREEQDYYTGLNEARDDFDYMYDLTGEPDSLWSPIKLGNMVMYEKGYYVCLKIMGTYIGSDVIKRAEDIESAAMQFLKGFDDCQSDVVMIFERGIFATAAGTNQNLNLFTQMGYDECYKVNPF